MKKKILFTIIAIYIISCVIIGKFWVNNVINHYIYYSWSEDSMPIKMKITNHNDSKTIVTPFFDNKIVAGKNIVYCAAFQEAWNKTKKEILNKYIVADLKANEYTNKLDKIWDCDTEIPIRPKNIDSKFTSTIENNIIKLSSSCIFDAKHEQKFQYIYEPIIFKFGTNEIAVKSFGFYRGSFSGYYYERHSPIELRSQVNIYPDKNTNDFVCIINQASSRERSSVTILSNLPPKDTLKDSFIDTVNFIRKNYHEFGFIGPENQLFIPKILFSIECNYDFFLNATDNNCCNDEISFAFGGAGNNVEKINSKFGSLFAGNRSYEFNSPFFIYVCEYNFLENFNKKIIWPYISIYVANDELLIKNK